MNLLLAWHLDTAATATMCQFCDTQACYSTFERTLKLGTFSFILCVRQAFLSAAARLFSAGLIDILGMFRVISQDRDGVIKHLKEATSDKQWFFLLSQDDTQLAGR
jgi:hypothetical protein